MIVLTKKTIDMIPEPQIAGKESGSSENVRERRHRKHKSHNKISKRSSKGKRKGERGGHTKYVSKHVKYNITACSEFSLSSTRKEREHVGMDDHERVYDMPTDELGTASYREKSIDKRGLALNRLRDEIRSERKACAYDKDRIPTDASSEYDQYESRFPNHLSAQRNEDHGGRMILDQEAPKRIGTHFENPHTQGPTKSWGQQLMQFSAEPSSESDTEELYPPDEVIPQHREINTSHSAKKSKPFSFTSEAGASDVRKPVEFSFASLRGNRGVALPPERVLRSDTIAKTSSTEPNIDYSEHFAGCDQTVRNSAPRKRLLPQINLISPFRSSSEQLSIGPAHRFPGSISQQRNLAPVSMPSESGSGIVGQRPLTNPEQDGAQGLLAMRNGSSRISEIIDECADSRDIAELGEIDENEESEDSGQLFFSPVGVHSASAVAKLENHQNDQDQKLVMQKICRYSFGPDERYYPCPECPRKFTSKCLLRKHLAVHRQNPPKCNDYGSVYKSQSALTTHERANASDPRYKCEICSRKFSYKGAFNNHLKKHIHLEPHRCKPCGFSTRKSEEFTHHMLRH